MTDRNITIGSSGSFIWLRKTLKNILSSALEWPFNAFLFDWNIKCASLQVLCINTVSVSYLHRSLFHKSLKKCRAGSGKKNGKKDFILKKKASFLGKENEE